MSTTNGGETEIRTHERVAPLPVFKTGAFNRSATPPFYQKVLLINIITSLTNQF